jgi:cytochrome c oxidase cbb3-type subunit 4
MDLQTFQAAVSSLWVVWFFVLFLGIVAWAFWPSRRAAMEQHGRIPLNDGE